MAVTLFHREIIIVKNRVTIKNKKSNEEEMQKETSEVIVKPKQLLITNKIRGKNYARRTVNRQN